MRHFLTTPLIVLSLFLFVQVPVSSADIGGTANGSSCELSGGGSGMVYNGQCLSPSNYPSQSGVTGGSGTTLINPLQAGTSLQGFLISILDFVIRIGTIVVILMLVYVGYLFVVAQGSDSKLSEAKHALLWTLIGALILLGAKAIALAIQATVQALTV